MNWNKMMNKNLNTTLRIGTEIMKKALLTLLIFVVMVSTLVPANVSAALGEQINLPPTPPDFNDRSAGDITTIYNLWQLYLVKDKCPDYAVTEAEKTAKKEAIKLMLKNANPETLFLMFMTEAGEFAGSSLHYGDVQVGLEKYGAVRDSIVSQTGRWNLHDISGYIKGLDTTSMFVRKAINAGLGKSMEAIELTDVEYNRGIAALEVAYQAKLWREQNLSTWESGMQSFKSFFTGNPLQLNVDVCARTDRNPGIDSRKGWDPNDLVIDPSGDGVSNWIRKEATLKFTINFENVESATATVSMVNIVMPLPEVVNGDKLKQLESTFAGAVMIYDNKNRVVRWILKGINLPPAGQGFVRFEAPLKADVAYGTEFSAAAKIYFDYNPPVETPVVTRRIAPAPSLTAVTIQSADGMDVLNWLVDKSAAIDHYDLYVSEFGGEYRMFERLNRPDNFNDPVTSYSLPIAAGTQRRFAVEAVDKLNQSSGIKAAEDANEIKVFVNGTRVIFDVPPIIKNGRTLVPFRKIFEALGAEVGWFEQTRTVTGIRGATEVKLTIGSTLATVNGVQNILDVPAEIMDGRTIVPARFISESLGADVQWVAATRTVLITLK